MRRERMILRRGRKRDEQREENRDRQREQSEEERKRFFFRLVHEYFIHIKMPPLSHCRKLSTVKLYDPHPYLDMYADSGPWLETMPQPMKGCTIQAYALCRMGSLSRHTCYDTAWTSVCTVSTEGPPYPFSCHLRRAKITANLLIERWEIQGQKDG